MTRPGGLSVAWLWTSTVPATAATILALLVAQRVFWPAPAGVLVQGVVIGGLTALISFGIALTYRANRIVNFAQGDLGTVPTMAAVLLLVGPSVPYFVALPLGLLVAVALGALVEFVVIRRFRLAPRLILTVATLGLAQLLAGLGLALPTIANDAFPNVFDIESAPTSFPSPFDAEFEIAPVVFGGNAIIAMAAVALCIVGLAAFFRFTNMGIAVRASAESEDRASLLGIPVRRVQTVVWVVAAVLAFLAVFMRAGVVGVPLGSVLGPAILIRALAACVIGGMTNLPLIFAGAVTLGLVEQAVIWDTRRAAVVAPILFVVILVMLLLQRRTKTARGDEQSSWQAVSDVRRIPAELARLPEVRWARGGLLAAVGLFALGLPVLASESTVNLAGVIVVFSMIGVSLVVLTGWAGQVSLGPVAFLAIGAAVGGAVTSRLGWDLAIALLVAGAVGAAVSIVIGLPALRIRGLLLAVTTLAFAQAVALYGLNQSDFGWWLPQGRLDRAPLLGLVPIESETQYYFFTLACLVLVMVMARRLRWSRVGRVMVGVRENERGAQAYGVNLVRAKLTAFAVAGFIAAFAGAVFVHHQRSLGIQPYATEESLAAFTMVVIGGLGSLPGAVLGAVYVRGAQYFLPTELSFFVSGVGLLVVLIVWPGGLGSVLYRLRDSYLRLVAKRRQIMVPSLFADARDLEAVDQSRERGLLFLHEMADRLEAGDASVLAGEPPPVETSD
ncbi:MAG TPA: ABC transporter permease, partial [Acidimicrobiales bacterium]|nr:ABC transporter permease [Acidimicrobiales bacterium]